LQEQPSVPQSRATNVADALRAYGISPSVIDTTGERRLQPGNGIDEANRRRVEITVEP
jgi:outer membrane protein OmpA-like peptidoglycan-associated protein